MTAVTATGTTPESGSSTSADACQGCGWSPGPEPEDITAARVVWPSLGGLACRWIEDNLIFADGDWFGRPFRLRRDQRLFLFRWYEFCAKCGQWRYDEALRGAASGDGKTGLVAAVACLEFAGPPQIAPASPIIPIAAASFEQADLLFGAVATMLGGQDRQVTEAPLCGLFEVYDTEIRFADGRPGRIYRIAAAAGTNEGGLPSLFIADELHEWGDVGSNKARVHTVVSKSTRKRRTRRGSGRVLNLSTAGFDVDHSLLGAMYKLGKRALRDRSLAPRFLFDWQEAPEGLDYRDPEQRALAVRAASAAADVLWSVADRVADWTKPNMPNHEWIRYYANRWVDVADESWLKDHPAAWPDCRGTWESSEANPFVLAVDMALKRDSVAVDRLERLPDGRTAVTARIWRAEHHDGRIPHADVWRYVRRLAVGAGFRGVVYDPRYFQLPAEQLEDEGVEVIEFDQQPARMAPACGHAFELIVNRLIVHDGDPELSADVLAAVKREQERGFTLSKGKSRRHIDGAVSLCMGVWVLEQVAEVAAEPTVAWL
jgi:phage terminase large subunit-like protein